MTPSTHTSPKIKITPQSALTDVPVSVQLVGFPPRRQVTVRARTRDDDYGRLWESYALYETDGTGCVDIAAQRPLEGTYQGADAMGLFWSMELDPSADDECYFRKRSLDPIHVTFTAEMDGAALVSATTERLFLAPGTIRTEVREAGLAGVLFRPADPGPHPGLVVLGGGDGGVLEHGAAMLASHGYAALALAYFGAETLPERPVEIPLEYFGQAIRWLGALPDVDARSVAIIGTSLGGLYALLTGATYPEVRAVVGYVPLGMLMSFEPKLPSPCTYQGEPLPCLRIEPTSEEQLSIDCKIAAREPVSGCALVQRTLQDVDNESQACIPVEKIRGPILLVTGEDDQAIPSPVFAERIMARLDRHGAPYKRRHLTYAGAGHAIGLPHAHGLPNVPTYGRAPASGPVFAFGGNARDNARANTDSWRQVLSFLEEALGN